MGPIQLHTVPKLFTCPGGKPENKEQEKGRHH